MADVVIDIIGKDDFSSVLGNFGSIMTGIKSTIDLVTGAFNAVAGAVTPFITSAEESQSAVANLEATLKSTGGAVGLTSQQLQDMAAGFQNVTKFSDETIVNGEAMLLTFTNIGKDVFPMATEAMLNLGEKFGSVDSAAVQLGKALNDPIAGISALSRVGVSFTDEQKDQIKAMMDVNDIAGAQGIILAELNKEFGGLAEAMGDTFAGKVEILKNRLDEMREQIGNSLLPLLEVFMDKFSEWLPVLENVAGRVAGIIDEITTGLTTGDWSGFMAGLQNLDSFIGNILAGFADQIDAWIASGGPDLLSDKIISFIDKIGSTTGFDSKILDAVGRIFAALARAFANIDWIGIADALDSALATSIQNHDWTSSGDAFGQALGNALSGSGGGIDSAGSAAIPAIAQALNDWFLAAAGVANWKQFGDVLGGIVVQYVVTPVKNALTTPWIYDVTHQWGIAIRDGLVSGLNAIEVNITDWFRDHIVTPVKTFLGIASPSTVFYDIGRNIVQGLMDGWSSMFTSLENLVKSTLQGMLDNTINPILDTLGLPTIELGGSTTTGTTGGKTGSGGTGTTTTGTPSTGAGTVVNQYFAGATINVGSWDQIAYDCLYPNPFVAASSGQQGTTGGKTGTPH